jgi:ribosomal protein L28
LGVTTGRGTQRAHSRSPRKPTARRLFTPTTSTVRPGIPWPAQQAARHG